ncbi:MAG TPA: hypothetical protein VMX94_06050 [Armatimonadota bacterium]|nr:hypothetical protein [Armatimonadota bacterium]
MESSLGIRVKGDEQAGTDRLAGRGKMAGNSVIAAEVKRVIRYPDHRADRNFDGGTGTKRTAGIPVAVAEDKLAGNDVQAHDLNADYGGLAAHADAGILARMDFERSNAPAWKAGKGWSGLAANASEH